MSPSDGQHVVLQHMKSAVSSCIKKRKGMKWKGQEIKEMEKKEKGRKKDNKREGKA